MAKKAIELKTVDKIYRMGEVEVPALRGVNVSIDDSEFVAITGPSGSGKSTLMHLIGCLDLPSHGQILLDGHDISRMTEDHLSVLRGKKIGFVFQKFNLINSLSAFENVELPLLFQDMNSEERRLRARHVLEIVGLGHRMNHRPLQMSGGEQQRVAIARALVIDPSFILADEPTGNLDSKRGAEIIAFLKRLHQEGKTVVMVTHDPELAKKADRIIKLKDGKVVS
ncbi:ABC transporter ATP-binding protein [Candidatus Micrarchaeota archaeon]|nr:ABC transporter ATP-binding protein [Candidatus Micrarchaeota archaeon]